MAPVGREIKKTRPLGPRIHLGCDDFVLRLLKIRIIAQIRIQVSAWTRFFST